MEGKMTLSEVIVFLVQFLYFLLFFVVTAWVIWKGIKKGIQLVKRKNK